MAPAPSNLAIRLATAAFMVPVMLYLMFRLPPVYFYGLVMVGTAVGSYELFRMTHPGDRIAQSIGVIVSVAFSLVVYLYGEQTRVLLPAIFLVGVQAVLVPLWRLGAIETAALRVTAGAFAPLYVGGLTLLSRVDLERGADGPGYVLLILMIGWFADSAGYFAGRFLGRHKLYPAVSPKKTVEGAVGGLGGSVLGACLAHFFYLKSLPLLDGVVLALVAGALGQAGDLGESLIKRSTGVKDSGAIVPGHGGILDRIDAVLIAAPVVYLYTRVFYG